LYFVTKVVWVCTCVFRAPLQLLVIPRLEILFAFKSNRFVLRILPFLLAARERPV
jgi:hypothetical protein